MTERLYLKDCYLRKFSAELIELTSDGVILDKSAFYPESGGQLGDVGEINWEKNSLNINNTVQKMGKVIHVVDSTEELEIGMMIEGSINWSHRYRQMRNHTAQHIISRYIQINHKAETVSTQLKNDLNRADFHPMGKLSNDDLKSISTKINEIITQNMPVDISFLPREEAISFLKSKNYQIKYLEMVPKSVKEFRIISIDNYDWAACGGTHVAHTSEIGEIKLIKTKNKGKLKERIFYSLLP